VAWLLDYLHDHKYAVIGRFRPMGVRYRLIASASARRAFRIAGAGRMSLRADMVFSGCAGALGGALAAIDHPDRPEDADEKNFAGPNPFAGAKRPGVGTLRKHGAKQCSDG
jgi:hypothetical protein